MKGVALTGSPWGAMRNARLIVILMVSAALLTLAFRDVAFMRLSSIILTARFRYLLLAVLLDVAVFSFKALKWRTIAASIRNLPFTMSISGIAVGALAGNVLPFRLDEIARIFYLGHRSGIARSAVLGTIVVERIIDATMLLLSVGVLTVLIGNNEWLAKGGRIVALALVVAMLLVAMVLVARRPLSKIVMRFSSARFGRAVDGALQNLALGLKAFPRGRRLLVVVTYAAGEWLVTLLHMRAVLAAFDIGIPAAGVIGLVTAVYLSFALPSGPGAIGLFELLVKGSLVVGFAIDPSKALGFALTLHVVLITPISLYGAICMAREGWALSRLMNASHREAHDELR